MTAPASLRGQPRKNPVCTACDGEEFLHVRSEVLPKAPVTLIQCEKCGAQFSTGVLELGLPVLAGAEDVK